MALAYARDLDSRSRVRMPLSPEQASYRFWASFVLFLLAFGIGAAWDRGWHADHPFEDFYSPPHLFIYTTLALAVATFVSLALSPERRAWFGASLRLPVLALEIPASLLLTLAGMGTVMFAGLLDNIWHTSFGLDETAWSTPHSMLGYGIILTWWGFLAGRLSLRRHIPISRPFALLAGLLSLTLPAGIFLGPLDNNQTIAVVQGVGQFPVLAATPAFQHTVRIATKYNLTFGNTAFLPLAALAIGFGLSFLWTFLGLSEDRAVSVPGRRYWAILRPFLAVVTTALAGLRWLTRGKLGFLLVALLATFLAFAAAHGRAVALDNQLGLDLAADPANFRPIPYVVAALGYVAAKAFRRGDGIAWAVAGFLFGIVVAAWWDHPAWSVLLAAPAMALGALLGRKVLAALQEPDWRAISALTAFAVGTPLLTGAFDLYMRSSTP